MNQKTKEPIRKNNSSGWLSQGLKAGLCVAGMGLLCAMSPVAKAQVATPAPETQQGSTAGSRDGAGSTNTTTTQLNLNTATEAELQTLPGIGPSKAAAIVAYRTRVKRFRRLEQLMRVRGVGSATFRKLRPMLTLEDAQP